MELLSVKVKKGRLDKTTDTSKTYVVLKVQNLKSTTIYRRGREPCWEQDFMFEIHADGKGFIIELWKKGLLWDSILGVLWIPLATVEYATDEGPGSWWRLHSEVIKNGSEIQGTKTPTSHEILLDIYFALPFDTHTDLDCRAWHRETPLQCTRHSHQDKNDSQPSMESRLSIQESKLRRGKRTVYIKTHEPRDFPESELFSHIKEHSSKLCGFLDSFVLLELQKAVWVGSLFPAIVKADEIDISDEYLEMNADVQDCLLQTNKHSEDVIFLSVCGHTATAV